MYNSEVTIDTNETIEIIESSFIDSKSEEIGIKIISVAQRIHILFAWRSPSLTTWLTYSIKNMT